MHELVESDSEVDLDFATVVDGRVPRPTYASASLASSGNSFPSVDFLLAANVLQEFTPLLPVPLIQVPKVRGGAGHRVRFRHKKTREIAIHANEILSSLNRLDAGLRTHRASRRIQSSRFTPAMRALHKRVWVLAAEAVMVRRDPALLDQSGARAASTLLKADQTDRYTFALRSHTQVPLVASALEEPGPGWPSCKMLDVLPWSEAQFYSTEENVVELSSKSAVLFNEIQHRYAFVGGDYSSYIEYFNRKDVDPRLWSWSTADDVKCIGGLSVVLKKNPEKQRKLLMTCAANYLWSSAKDRSELGMMGGGGLAAIYAADGQAQMAAWDQSSAFTAVETPEWFWPWMAVPPVRASHVWHRLPPSLRADIAPWSWVFPRYTRLAMGSSHSVHILMSINLEIVGRTLVRTARLGTFRSEHTDTSTDVGISGTSFDTPLEDVEEDIALAVNEDDLWATAHQQKRLQSAASSKPRTLAEFVFAARAAKRAPRRVFVVLHCFSGENRDFDLEWWLLELASRNSLSVLVASVDLGADLAWDLTNYETFHELYEMSVTGLLDAVVGGPPCSTWSRLRFLAGGPRPLRFRDSPWGRRDATAVEHDRLTEGNLCMINFMALCEAVAVRGGLYLQEHPEDPGEDPFPSIWATAEHAAFELRASGHKCKFDQCPLGGETRKPTCVSTNICGFPDEGPRCPGNHVHGRSRGRTSDGAFRSRRLSSYPSGVCEWLATKICHVFTEWAVSGTGPTGWLKRTSIPASLREATVAAEEFAADPDSIDPVSFTSPSKNNKTKWSRRGHSRYAKDIQDVSEANFDNTAERFHRSLEELRHIVAERELPSNTTIASKHITHWSFSDFGEHCRGVSVINENAANGKRTVIDKNNDAFYLHVDDGIFIGHELDHTNFLMLSTAEALEDEGFTVTERFKAPELDKIVGYEKSHGYPGLVFPAVKGQLLARALLHLANQRSVQIEALRALVGVWLFGALLRRELLSITGHVFTFIERFSSGVHTWWESARLEVLIMAKLVCFMRVNFTLPAGEVMFATDAQGHSGTDDSSFDNGGYGIVAADLSLDQTLASWRSSFTPGLSVCKLDGSLGSKFSSKTSLIPTIPFCRFPKSIFDNDWQVLATGRWRYKDHITSGEARAHFKCLQGLAACVRCHDHRLLLLENNTGVPSSMMKGRATAPALNYYCRRRGASNLASGIYSCTPWVQTSKMPADSASRLVPFLTDSEDYKHGRFTPDWAPFCGHSSIQQNTSRFSRSLQEVRPKVPVIHH